MYCDAFASHLGRNRLVFHKNKLAGEGQSKGECDSLKGERCYKKTSKTFTLLVMKTGEASTVHSSEKRKSNCSSHRRHFKMNRHTRNSLFFFVCIFFSFFCASVCLAKESKLEGKRRKNSMSQMSKRVEWNNFLLLRHCFSFFFFPPCVSSLLSGSSHANACEREAEKRKKQGERENWSPERGPFVCSNEIIHFSVHLSMVVCATWLRASGWYLLRAMWRLMASLLFFPSLQMVCVCVLSQLLAVASEASNMMHEIYHVVRWERT